MCTSVSLTAIRGGGQPPDRKWVWSGAKAGGGATDTQYSEIQLQSLCTAPAVPGTAGLGTAGLDHSL